MYPEYYEEFHYVDQAIEPVEREILPIAERIQNQNLWHSNDWYYYDQGKVDGDLGVPSKSDNPFYQIGYKKAQAKYQ